MVRAEEVETPVGRRTNLCARRTVTPVRDASGRQGVGSSVLTFPDVSRVCSAARASSKLRSTWVAFGCAECGLLRLGREHHDDLHTRQVFGGARGSLPSGGLRQQL